MAYRPISVADRFAFPCFYALDAATSSLEIRSGGYDVHLGAALAEQLRSALLGLCRGTGRMASVDELSARLGGLPGVLFLVTASASMAPAGPFGGTSGGVVQGSARVLGPDGSESARPLFFSGSASNVSNYGEAGQGAEGLRGALHEAVQRLVDEALLARREVERVGRNAVPPGAPGP
jgi:hypothetical protein